MCDHDQHVEQQRNNNNSATQELLPQLVNLEKGYQLVCPNTFTHEFYSSPVDPHACGEF